MLTDSERAAVEGELPALPTDRWWGDHLREIRWQLELGRLLVDPVFRGAGVPRGDGQPVILMPGLGAGDQTLLVLAAWLRHIGYRPHLCGFVANISCSDRAAERVERRLEAVHARYDSRVALIGHSRGGHFARALGHRRPELVSHVISIGAGLRQMLAVSYPTQTAVRGIRAALLRTGRAESSRCLTDTCDCAFARDFAAPFPADRVRLTSIYSKQDGVVRWESALVDGADCLEVTGSHTGLIFNRKTYHAIASTLAEPNPHTKGRRSMSTNPKTPASSEGAAEIGPPPYYHRSDCNICRKQDDLKTGSALLDAPRPGGYIVEGEHFLVEHAPLQESSAGTVIVEARRHLLDFGEMTPTESAELGPVLHRLVPAIKAATGVERVYYLAVMERAPHFHLWLVPKKDEGELRGVDYLAQRPPLTTSYSEAETMARKIRAEFNPS